MNDERTICRYAGAQITNTREQIRIRFDGVPHRRVPGELWNKGFKRDEDGSFFKRHSPIAIQDAQAVLKTHYGEEIP